MVQLYCHFMETRRKAPCGQAASVGVPVGCVRIAKAALTACGGKTETAKKDAAHEAVTFMAPYMEVEAFIEQVHSVYPKEAGMNEHLSKPVDIAALEQTVKRFRVTSPH